MHRRAKANGCNCLLEKKAVTAVCLCTAVASTAADFSSCAVRRKITSKLISWLCYFTETAINDISCETTVISRRGWEFSSLLSQGPGLSDVVWEDWYLVSLRRRSLVVRSSDRTRYGASWQTSVVDWPQTVPKDDCMAILQKTTFRHAWTAVCIFCGSWTGTWK